MEITKYRIMALRVFEERVQGLVNDGYHIVFKSSSITADLLHCKLRHHNGTHIVLFGYVSENRIVQKTDGRITHSGALYQS